MDDMTNGWKMAGRQAGCEREKRERQRQTDTNFLWLIVLGEFMETRGSHVEFKELLMPLSHIPLLNCSSITET